MVFQASPYGGRLAAKCRRIGFVNLQAAGSSPVALHPASRRRSYSRLRTPRQRATGTHTPLTKRPHGRTPDLLRRPWVLAHSAHPMRRSSGNRWSTWSAPAAIPGSDRRRLLQPHSAAPEPLRATSLTRGIGVARAVSTKAAIALVDKASERRMKTVSTRASAAGILWAATRQLRRSSAMTARGNKVIPSPAATQPRIPPSVPNSSERTLTSPRDASRPYNVCR